MSERMNQTSGEEYFVDEHCYSSPSVKRSHSSQSLLIQKQPHSISNRGRLDTEETYRVKNNSVPVQSSDPNSTGMFHQFSFATDEACYENPFQSVLSRGDDASVISSLSNDDDSVLFVQRNSVLSPVIEAECTRRSTTLPAEVDVPIGVLNNPDQRDSMMERLVARLAIRQNSPPPVQTRSLHSLVERPTLGRNHSCPVRMDFSVASSSMPSSTISGNTFSIPEDSVIINGALIEGIRHRDGDLSIGESFDYSSLLGNRKRRVHHRVHSGTEISVGSIVGQSTLLTSPSTTASITESEASSVRKALRSAHIAEEMLLNVTGADDGIACCQVRRPKNIVKKELKFVAGKLASPIRKIPMFSEKKAELKRASGSLV